MDQAIDTQGLTKRYGSARGVQDLTLSVLRGEVFGFLGPKGTVGAPSARAGHAGRQTTGCGVGCGSSGAEADAAGVRDRHAAASRRGLGGHAELARSSRTR